MAWDWAAITSAALQAVGSMQASSSARASSKEDWAARLEEMRMQIAGQRDLQTQARGYQLQDRAYNRDQINNYSGFYDGPALKPVAPISTEVVNTPQTTGLAVKPPAAAAPVKPPKKKKKKGWLSRLF